ncbi:MAG: hypothetical protein QOJ15_10504 [Bradyrhizobium sp.]|jgi:hypothetical protein|nr:hypothetical protein [Bradyrhizobium sp.]
MDPRGYYPLCPGFSWGLAPHRLRGMPAVVRLRRFMVVMPSCEAVSMLSEMFGSSRWSPGPTATRAVTNRSSIGYQEQVASTERLGARPVAGFIRPVTKPRSVSVRPQVRPGLLRWLREGLRRRSVVGQARRLGHVGDMSGLPQTADISDPVGTSHLGQKPTWPLIPYLSSIGQRARVNCNAGITVPLGAEACPARISAIVMHIRAEGGSGSTIGIETRRNLRPVTYSKR